MNDTRESSFNDNFNYYRRHHLGGSEDDRRGMMSDLIDRQAAIDALERKKDKNAKGDIGGFYNKIIQNDIDALMQLPSAQLNVSDTNVGDIISRQAAITLPIMPKEHREYKTYNLDDAYEQGWFDLQKCIEELPPAQPEQRWIPVSERLPDVAQRVLLSGHGQVMVGMLHSFGKYSLEPTGISYVYPKDDIEAWMPLPEPWKGNAE